MDNVSRETLGRVVRDAWIAWAEEQPNAKPSWLVPWDLLAEPDKEADRRIGQAVKDYVSRETSGKPVELPLLFWRVCADDPDMQAPDKIAWLTASYQHLVMLAGLTMPGEQIDKQIGVAAAMSRISDLLLAIAGQDDEIDKFIVKWLCFACDQLWELVPPTGRNMPDPIDTDNPEYSKWLRDMETRLPGLSDIGDPVKNGGEVMIVICPVCNIRHYYPLKSSLCDVCRAPLNHIQPVPYSTARRLEN